MSKRISAKRYNVFSYHLLKIISPFKDVDKLKHGWKKYFIHIQNQEIINITQKTEVATVRGVEKNSFDLFLDLLIEYTIKKEYEKSVRFY